MDPEILGLLTNEKRFEVLNQKKATIFDAKYESNLKSLKNMDSGKEIIVGPVQKAKEDFFDLFKTIDKNEFKNFLFAEQKYLEELSFDEEGFEETIGKFFDKWIKKMLAEQYAKILKNVKNNMKAILHEIEKINREIISYIDNVKMFNNLIEKDAQFFEECVEEYKDNNEQKLDKENDIIKEARERFNASYRIKSELDFDIIREILIVKEDCKYISENFTKFQKSIEKDCEELREVFYKFGGNYTGFFEEEIKFVYLDNLIKEVEAEEEMKEILKRKAEETEIKMSLEE